MKKLYLHIGAPKTGSTAIQSFLYHNRTLLKREFDLSYIPLPEDDGETISSGNAMPIYWAVQSKREQECADLITELFDSTPGAVGSCENIFWFSKADFRFLHRAAERAEVEICFVCFLREVADTYVSLYNHTIKRDGQTASFVEYYLTNAAWTIRPIKAILDLFGKDAILLLNYSSDQAGVIPDFLRSIGVSVDKFASASEQSSLFKKANRSLSKAEYDAVLFLNSVLPSFVVQEFVDMLMVHGAAAPKNWTLLSSDVLQLLESRHCDDLKWINERMPKPLAMSTVQRPARDPRDTADDFNDFSFAFKWVALRFSAYLTEMRKERRDDFIRTVEDARARCQNSPFQWDPSIPSSFDPLVYLVMNPDVFLAGTDPYEHFVSHGRLEGRVWASPFKRLAPAISGSDHPPDPSGSEFSETK